ncbi:hypothetical protein BH10PSE9_BH10PSE9_05450 [soil metagenome]
MLRFFLHAISCLAAPIASANIIDGTDERGSILAVGPGLGLSAEEIVRIRKVSGHVGCFEPRPEVGSGALFLTSDLILTAGHIFFDEAGKRAGKCFFRPQTPGSEWLPLLTDAANARIGAVSPKPGSNNDWAVVRLAKPIAGAVPFPLPTAAPKVGDALIVVTAQPAGFEKLDPNVPVAQGCKIRRVPVSTAGTSFYRTDCDATGASSGGMHLTRIGGALAFRGITITTGPWQDERLRGAPYDEQGGSVTTALGTDAAILAAAKALSPK